MKKIKTKLFLSIGIISIIFMTYYLITQYHRAMAKIKRITNTQIPYRVFHLYKGYL